MAANVPQFTSGMSDDQVKAAVNAYEQAAGLPPSDASTWINYYHQFGSNDPNYFTTRLLNGIATDQHGNMQAFADTQNPNTPGGWGPGTSGFGPSSGGQGGGAGGGGGFSFTPQDVANDPGYQFALGQGLNAIQGSAAAKGTLLGTGTEKDLANYAAGAAYQGENQLFNQNLASFQTNFNNLGQLTNTGLGGIGAQQGALQAGANASAAGTVGVANQITGAANDFGNAIQNQQLYKSFNPSATSPAIYASGATHPMGPYMPPSVSPALGGPG